MTKWTIKPLDRECAEQILAGIPHHLQSSLAWHDFICGYSNETERSVSIEHDGRPFGFVCALQYRNLIQSLPYPASYAGLQTARPLSEPEGRELYQSLYAHYSRYCDIVSICTSPFYKAIPPTDTLDFLRRNDVHYIDLTAGTLANTNSKFRNNLRRNLQKSEKAKVRIGVSWDRGDLIAWYRCYERRMSELGGAVLPAEYFEQMFDRLTGINACSLITAKSDGMFLGGIITVHNRHCVDYYLSMFDREYDEMQASTAAFYFLLEYARSLGAKILNLQSSPGSQTELIRFKESWGAQRTQHTYVTKIVNNRDEITRMTAAEITENYRFHYLLPFEALDPDRGLHNDSKTRTKSENHYSYGVLA